MKFTEYHMRLKMSILRAFVMLLPAFCPPPAGVAQTRPTEAEIEGVVCEIMTRTQAKGMAVAGVYIGLGDKDKAFEWLEKDFQSRTGRLTEIRWQIPFEPLRSDPRFKDLLRRMNLPE